MKLEIEVSEDLLTNHLQQYVKNNLTNSYLPESMKRLVEDQAKKQ